MLAPAIERLHAMKLPDIAIALAGSKAGLQPFVAFARLRPTPRAEFREPGTFVQRAARCLRLARAPNPTIPMLARATIEEGSGVGREGAVGESHWTT